MPTFTAEVPHSLGQAGAKERLEGFLEQVGQAYKGQIGEIEGSWDDHVLNLQFSTFGIPVSGKISVEEDKVILQGELPFSAMMFKGKIAGGIQKALANALA